MAPEGRYDKFDEEGYPLSTKRPDDEDFLIKISEEEFKKKKEKLKNQVEQWEIDESSSDEK